MGSHRNADTSHISSTNMARTTVVGAILTIIGLCTADTYDHDDALQIFGMAFAAICESEEIENWNFAQELFEENTLSNFVVSQVIETENLQCFTGYDRVNERYVISFRGSNNFNNWLTNFNAIPAQYPNAPQLDDPKIHPGFLAAFRALEEAGLRDAIIAMFAEEADVLVTGHSLGGALATVAALELKQNPRYQALNIRSVAAWPFASPRVVNQELAALFNDVMDSSWRVVYRYDPVATVPTKAMGYYHVGTEVWYNYQRWWWNMDPMSYRICDGTGEDSDCWGTDFWMDRLPVIDNHFEYFGLFNIDSLGLIAEIVTNGISMEAVSDSISTVAGSFSELCNQKEE